MNSSSLNFSLYLKSLKNVKIIYNTIKAKSPICYYDKAMPLFENGYFMLDNYKDNVMQNYKKLIVILFIIPFQIVYWYYSFNILIIFYFS